jgi:hypothetical protein
MANHTIGVISTPKAGGTDPLIILNNGSVGHTTILYGASFKFAFGYHEMTTRQSIANEKIFKNGPNTFAKGCTHGSVSVATINVDGSTTEVVVVVMTLDNDSIIPLSIMWIFVEAAVVPTLVPTVLIGANANVFLAKKVARMNRILDDNMLML